MNLFFLCKLFAITYLHVLTCVLFNLRKICYAITFQQSIIQNIYVGDQQIWSKPQGMTWVLTSANLKEDSTDKTKLIA